MTETVVPAGEETTMDPIKRKSVVWTGTIGGIATIVGVALPWLVDSGATGSGFSVNGLLAGPYVLLFGAIMAGASLFLLADADPRKVAAVLGPASLAVLAYVTPIVFDKEAGLFGGISEGTTTERGIGLYVCLVGGVLGLVAVGIAAKGLVSSAVGSEPSGFDLGDVGALDD